MFLRGWRIALAWIAFISEPASCERPEHAQKERQRERGEPNPHGEDEREEEPEESNVFPASSPEVAKFIANVTVVNYRFDDPENATKKWFLEMNSQTSDAELKGMCEILKLNCDYIGYPSLEGVPYVEVSGTDTEVETMILQSNVSVIYIELKLDFEIPVPPIDTDFSDHSLWGPSLTWADGRGAEVGQGVSIFILDSGVRHTHIEFSGRSVPAAHVYWGGIEECNGDLSCALDVGSMQHAFGHGSMCAGQAAGQTVGVATGATIRAVKFRTGPRCCGEFEDAMRWIRHNSYLYRPAIISYSFGAKGKTSRSKELQIDLAVASGMVFLTAAGNEDIDACEFSPADLPSAIAVGAIALGKENGKPVKAGFSNFGSCVDLWAPGQGVTAVHYSSDDSYREGLGTSAACPFAAGMVAAIWGVSKNASAQEVRHELMITAEQNALGGLSPARGDRNLFVSARRLPFAVATPALPPGPTPPPTEAPCNAECYNSREQCRATPACYETLACPCYKWSCPGACELWPEEYCNWKVCWSIKCTACDGGGFDLLSMQSRRLRHLS